MYISWNWLGRHVDLTGLDPRAVGAEFTLKVAELEGVHEVGAGLGDFRAVLIEAVEPITDKLTKVAARDGDRVLQIVCGAPNAREAVGRVAALAPAGTRLPDGKEIGEAEIRGVKSSGMLASEKELGISEEHGGILLLSPGTAHGVPLYEAAPIHDWVFEIDNKAITNRPDLWGHYGVAREVALLTGRALRPLDPRPAFGAEKRVSAAVLDPVLCPRYLCAAFTGVRIAPSPEWLRCLLRATGVRPISNVVDLTNFVMMDAGNPLHAFDARFVSGSRIIVRRADAGEVLRTLDGQDRACTAETLLICDADKPVALAGVMGGLNSEIKDDTTDVILESANFQSGNIRRTASRLGLRTESSARFEKSLDPMAAELAAREFAALLPELSPGAVAVGTLVDVCAPLPKPPAIALNPKAVAARLGVEVTVGEIRQVLKSLGFDVQDQSTGNLRVIVPSWRATKDVSLPEDLIEEVGRIRGYMNIPPRAPRVEVKPPLLRPEKAQERAVRQLLSFGCGMSEALSYAFTWRPTHERIGATLEGHLSMQNPISAEMDKLRRSIVPNLLTFAERNARFESAFALYEVGRVFEPVDGALPTQHRTVAAVIVHPESDGDAEARFRKVKGIVSSLLEKLHAPDVAFRRPGDPGFRAAWLHPTRSAEVTVAGTAVGTFGPLHPKAAQLLEIGGPVSLLELDLDDVLAAGEGKAKYEPLPRFPAMAFDVSFEVSADVTAAALEAAVRESAASPWLRSCEVFANYHLDGGRKSVSFHLVFRDDERSLADTEVRPRVDAVVAHVASTFGAKLRGG